MVSAGGPSNGYDLTGNNNVASMCLVVEKRTCKAALAFLAIAVAQRIKHMPSKNLLLSNRNI